MSSRIVGRSEEVRSGRGMRRGGGAMVERCEVKVKVERRGITILYINTGNPELSGGEIVTKVPLASRHISVTVTVTASGYCGTVWCSTYLHMAAARKSM